MIKKTEDTMQILLLVFSLHQSPAPVREIIHHQTMAACHQQEEKINASESMTAKCVQR